MEPFKCDGATAPGYHISRSAAATTTVDRALARDRGATRIARAAMEDLADRANMVHADSARETVKKFF